MKQELKCPICKEELYTGLGQGCKMCGMPLDNSQKKFCSKECKIKYNKIRRPRK